MYKASKKGRSTKNKGEIKMFYTKEELKDYIISLEAILRDWNETYRGSREDYERRLAEAKAKYNQFND